MADWVSQQKKKRRKTFLETSLSPPALPFFFFSHVFVENHKKFTLSGLSFASHSSPRLSSPWLGTVPITVGRSSDLGLCLSLIDGSSFLVQWDTVAFPPSQNRICNGGNVELSAIAYAFIMIGSNHYNRFLTMITFSNRARERAFRFTQQCRVFVSQDCPTTSRTEKKKNRGH